jgi:hypothetical protein
MQAAALCTIADREASFDGDSEMEYEQPSRFFKSPTVSDLARK